MHAALAEDLEEQVGAAIDHEGVAREAGDRVDHSQHLHDPDDPIEAVEAGFGDLEQVEPDQPGELLCLLGRVVTADDADIGFARPIEWGETGEKEQSAGLSRRKEPRDGGGGGGSVMPSAPRRSSMLILFQIRERGRHEQFRLQVGQIGGTARWRPNALLAGLRPCRHTRLDRLVGPDVHHLLWAFLD